MPVNGLAIGAPYWWRVRVRFNNPYFPVSRWESPVRSGVREYDLRGSGTTWVDAPELTGAVTRLALSEPSPNPSHGTSRVAFSLPRAGRVMVEIVDLQGRRVRTLVDGERAAGSHAATWDGRDDAGRTAGAGVYFVRATSAGERTSRKLAKLD